MSGTYFQYEFKFVIGLPYLAIISGILNMEHIIYVTCLGVIFPYESVTNEPDM